MKFSASDYYGLTHHVAYNTEEYAQTYSVRCMDGIYRCRMSYDPSTHRFKSFSTDICEIRPKEKLVILDDGYFSQTTQKQIYAIRQAFSHWEIVYVPNLESYNYGFADYYQSLRNLPTRKDGSLSRKADREKLARYVETLKRIKIKNFSDQKGILKELENNFPKLQKQEQKRKEREEKKRKQLEKYAKQPLGKIRSLETLTSSEKQIIYELKYGEHINAVAWLEGDEIHTSKNVCIPLDKYIKTMIYYYCEKGETQSLVGKHISSFTINEVSEDYIKIGCHTLAKQNIKELMI